MILFAVVMYCLIWMSGLFASTIILDREDGNKSGWYQWFFAIACGLLGAYYVVTFAGMAVRVS